MKGIKYNKDGLHFIEKLPDSISYIESIKKDDLIECLLKVNKKKEACSIDINNLKSLLIDFEQLQQYVSYKEVKSDYSKEMYYEDVKINFLNSQYISKYNLKIPMDFTDFFPRIDNRYIKDQIRNGVFSLSSLVTAPFIKMEKLELLIESRTFPDYIYI